MNGSCANKTRRDFLALSVPVGALCVGCPGALGATLTGAPAQAASRFSRQAGLTFREVFEFAYTNAYIPHMNHLAEAFESRDAFLSAVREGASEFVGQAYGRLGRSVPVNDLATFTEPLRNPNATVEGIMGIDVVEFSPDACELRITECLWAEVFRSAGAADLGSASACFPDYAAVSAFNPRLKMVRDKTLMEGHDHCNHRYVPVEEG